MQMLGMDLSLLIVTDHGIKSLKTRYFGVVSKSADQLTNTIGYFALVLHFHSTPPTGEVESTS